MTANQKSQGKMPIRVDLSTGQVLKIGQIRWRRGLIPVKNLLLQILQSTSVQAGLTKLIESFATAPQIDDEEDEKTIVERGQEFFNQFDTNDLKELVSVLPEAAAEVSVIWDELTEVMVQGTVEPDENGLLPSVDFDDLTHDDVEKLRDAVNEINDWNKIWNTEKNSIVGMFNRVIKPNMPTGTETQSNQNGGLESKPSLSGVDSP